MANVSTTIADLVRQTHQQISTIRPHRNDVFIFNLWHTRISPPLPWGGSWGRVLLKNRLKLYASFKLFWKDPERFFQRCTLSVETQTLDLGRDASQHRSQIGLHLIA